MGRFLPTPQRTDGGQTLGKPTRQRSYPPGSSRETILRRERDLVIPYLCKLVTRQRVLDGYVAQCDLLHTAQMTPAAFEQKLLDLNLNVEECVILLPESQEASAAAGEEANLA